MWPSRRWPSCVPRAFSSPLSTLTATPLRAQVRIRSPSSGAKAPSTSRPGAKRAAPRSSPKVSWSYPPTAKRSPSTTTESCGGTRRSRRARPSRRRRPTGGTSSSAVSSCSCWAPKVRSLDRRHGCRAPPRARSGSRDVACSWPRARVQPESRKAVVAASSRLVSTERRSTIPFRW